MNRHGLRKVLVVFFHVASDTYLIRFSVKEGFPISKLRKDSLASSQKQCSRDRVHHHLRPLERVGWSITGTLTLLTVLRRTSNTCVACAVTLSRNTRVARTVRSLNQARLGWAVVQQLPPGEKQRRYCAWLRLLATQRGWQLSTSHDARVPGLPGAASPLNH